MHGTWPMCRAVVAARLTVPDRPWAVFRALQVAQFTTTLDLETADGIAAALARVPDLDVDALIEACEAPETEEAFEADREETRTAAGTQTEFQGKAATTPDGRVRYTAPSLTFTTEDGRTLVIVLEEGTLTNGISLMELSTGRVEKLVTGKVALPQAVEELYLAAWGRFPSPDEQKKAEGWVKSAPTLREGLQDLLWVLINSREFQFNK
jgi:hypothetical protein